MFNLTNYYADSAAITLLNSRPAMTACRSIKEGYLPMQVIENFRKL